MGSHELGPLAGPSEAHRAGVRGPSEGATEPTGAPLGLDPPMLNLAPHPPDDYPLDFSLPGRLCRSGGCNGEHTPVGGARGPDGGGVISPY